MTRGRTKSPESAPGTLEAEYYAQRASAGLIITGGAYISKQAIDSIRVPSIYNNQRVEAWARVTSVVHNNGGKVYVQIAHSGSVSHLPGRFSRNTPFAEGNMATYYQGGPDGCTTYPSLEEQESSTASL
ncbi:hypothetical protein [Granulicella sp. dw_53]|uniref:oxidoreductase n=1 Tax=Granulicella sp. dw_53 TaxID=2719792 RepID=UPI001BD3FB64|nr:hypothetical protein [Granulicella sp. dw_53]